MAVSVRDDLSGLPGASVVAAGLDDLAAGRRTTDALLVSMAATRLRAVGIDVPPGLVARPGHELYDDLRRTDPRTAHSRYNALIRLVASFARAAEHAGTR